MNKLVLLPLLLLSASVSATEYRLMVHSPGMQAKQESPQGQSCMSLKNKSPGLASGVYTISNNGKKYDVYCDMVSEGGGWTMVVAQFEQDPVTNWNEGIQPDYDPSLATKKGFALNEREIPEHNELSFGKDLDSNFIDYFNFKYSTYNINLTTIWGRKTGRNYYIHRNMNLFFSDHNPDNGYQNGPDDWNNTLAISALEGIKRNWAFSPLHKNPASRGYAINGLVNYQFKNIAWTVWVR